MNKYLCSIRTFHREISAHSVEHAALQFVHWYYVETLTEPAEETKVLVNGMVYHVYYPSGHVRKHKF